MSRAKWQPIEEASSRKRSCTIDRQRLSKQGLVDSFIEFTDTGEVAVQIQTRPWHVASGRVTDLYPVYKFDWVAQPSWKTVMVEVEQVLYISWNGAAEVDPWPLEVLRPPRIILSLCQKSDLKPECDHLIPSHFYQAIALDKDGNELDSPEILEMHRLSSPTLLHIPGEYLTAMKISPFILG
ncbi:hypothetical protein EAF04_010092 [Stromatinia cepivora]|nr:hypothetical protein EAF04_010092 [Stromatinia cepivora]